MSSSRRPNIVVLVADDHSGPLLGHLGAGDVRTPHLDALAARGTSFTGHHCQGGMHGAICVPSRASLMTGRSIFDSAADPTGQDYARSLTIPRSLPMFPQDLGNAGYTTFGVGKWHNDAASFNRAFAGGDAMFFGGMSDHWAVPIRPYDPTGRYPDDAVTIGNGFSTDLFADAAIHYIESVDLDNSFLLYTAFTAPHDPRTPPPGWEIPPDQVAMPPNLYPMHPFDNGWMVGRDENLAAHPRSRAEVRQHRADYLGMIWHLDDAVGRIVAALKARHLLEHTVLIYTGDHGLAVGQHGLMGKQNLYQHSQRIPLVMAGPGIPEGQIFPGLSWHGDTTATIRALAGLEPVHAIMGQPLVTRSATLAPGRTTHGAAFAYGQRSIRDERYKLIRYLPVPPEQQGGEITRGSATLQLFDLETDPWETANLAPLPEHAARIERLLAALAAWQVEVHDPLAVS